MNSRDKKQSRLPWSVTDVTGVCAVIVAYRPDNDFPARVARVARQVGAIVIVNNGVFDDHSRRALIALECLADSVNVLELGMNRGIAHALNEGFEWARRKGYRWVLTLDQDSVVRPDMVETLLRVYATASIRSSSNRPIGILGSNYWATPENTIPAVRGSSGSEWIETTTVITSGSLIPVELWMQVGGFREEFFIDQVDHDFCLRVRSRGLAVGVTAEVLMEHTIGNGRVFKLGPFKLGTTNHPSWRRYYMARNHIILAREYFLTEPAWVCKSLLGRVKSLLLICMFEDHKLEKVCWSLKGVLDGVRGKLDRDVSK